MTLASNFIQYKSKEVTSITIMVFIDKKNGNLATYIKVNDGFQAGVIHHLSEHLGPVDLTQVCLVWQQGRAV